MALKYESIGPNSFDVKVDNIKDVLFKFEIGTEKHTNRYTILFQWNFYVLYSSNVIV